MDVSYQVTVEEYIPVVVEDHVIGWGQTIEWLEDVEHFSSGCSGRLAGLPNRIAKATSCQGPYH